MFKKYLFSLIFFVVFGCIANLVYAKEKGTQSQGFNKEPQTERHREKEMERELDRTRERKIEKEQERGQERKSEKEMEKEKTRTGWTGDIPPGLEKKEGWVPSGWSEGEKKGWLDSYPPGWDKLNNKEQKTWKEELKIAKQSVEKNGEKLKFSEQKRKQISNNFEIACRSGVPVKHSKEMVLSAMNKGLKSQDIEKMTKGVSYGVNKGIKSEEMNKFVHQKLNEGLKGDNLSLEIYKEVQKRERERSKIKKETK